MKLKSNDSTKKLFQAFGRGLIKQEDIINLVESRKIELGAHLSWTLDQFATITQLASDIEIVRYLLKIEKEKLSLPNRIFFKTNPLKINVKKYLETLKFAKDGVKDISDAIGNIKQPAMSAKMIQSGFGKLNFGDLGMARTIGAFENIGTLKAYELPMHLVIQSLDQNAAIKRCEQAHSEILEAEIKTKKYRS